MKVLFVCLGNICRSPLAEELFRQHITSLGLHSQFTIDSCGTGDWHAGEKADPRTRRNAAEKGIELTHRARQIRPEDFTEFDHLFVMDHSNFRDVVALSPAHSHKVRLMTSYSEKHKDRIIPDPYTGGEEDFEMVFQLLNQVSSELAQYFHQQYRNA